MIDNGRRNLFITLLTCSLLLCVSVAEATLPRIDMADQARQHLPKGTSGEIGIHLVHVGSGQVIGAYRADRPMIPASNMKLLTTAAALKSLGSDFSFRTELRLHQNTLIVRGDGDPAFGDPNLLAEHDMTVDDLLDRWVGLVKRHRPDGVDRLLVDDRIFDQQWVHPTWPEDQLTEWYCAPVGGLNFNDNCLDIYAAPTSPGQPARVWTSPTRTGYTLDNNTRSGGRNAFWAQRDDAKRELRAFGTVPRELTAPINLTVADPGAYFTFAFAENLKHAGLPVGGVGRVTGSGDAFPGSVPIGIVRTPLPIVLARTNRDSQNLFAEALLKRIGYQESGQPGSWKNGAAAVRQILTDVDLVGPAARQIIIADGSGMSRDNRVSPVALTTLLANVHQTPDWRNIYLDSLAVGGSDGTLRRRFQKGYNAQIIAKSGYIRGVIALSGYLIYDDQVYAFSILINDFTGAPWQGRQTIDRILLHTDRQLSDHHRQQNALAENQND